jgi:hypothetical protein
MNCKMLDAVLAPLDHFASERALTNDSPSRLGMVRLTATTFGKCPRQV